jgi:hypothetical protein
MPQSVEEVRNLSWQQLEQLCAALFMDEIAAVTRNGGEELVREKLVALSPGQRRLVREALDELELV